MRSAQGRGGPPAPPVGQRGGGQPAHAQHCGHPAGLGGAALCALPRLLVQEPAVCATDGPHGWAQADMPSGVEAVRPLELIFITVTFPPFREGRNPGEINLPKACPQKRTWSPLTFSDLGT